MGKITVQLQNQPSNPDQLRIESANYLFDYAIRLKFNDGTERVIDFKAFVFNALHPSIAKYRDESLFANFCLQDGNLNWNDYDMIFPIWDLYQGSIVKKSDKT